MIAARGLPEPDAGQLRACALAAAAEGAMVALLVHVVLDSARTMDLGVGPFAVGFVAVYVLGAVLACRFRSSPNLVPGAAVVAVLAGVTVGGGGTDRTAFTAVVALLVTFRIVSLGGRDWRTPILPELGWWTAILGLETLLAAGPIAEWRGALLVVVPAAVACALASRAVTVWTGDEEAEPDGTSWVRRSMSATAALAVAMVGAVGLAVSGGLFDLVGRWLRPLVLIVAAVLIWLAAQAARPIFWLAERLGIDPAGFREALERLRSDAVRDRPPEELLPTGSSAVQRFLGLLVLAAIGFVLYRVLRRWWSRPAPEAPHPHERIVAGSTRAVTERIDPPRRWRFRAELPADAVRRLYAEVLLDLREHRLTKDPSLTPAEFVPVVAAEFPPCADDFGALSRSYQHVRYGNRRMDRAEIRDLEFRQRRLRGTLRRMGHGPVTGRQ